MRFSRPRERGGLPKWISRSFKTSMRSLKIFLGFGIGSILLFRQYEFSTNVESFYLSSVLQQDDLRNRVLTTNNSTTSSLEPAIEVNIRDGFNFTDGERWKASVRIELMNEERNRLKKNGSKNKQGLKNVEKNFQRLHSRLDHVDPSEIDDPSNWHKVTPEGYKETLKKARVSMEEMVDKVYLDCIMWLLPHPNITAMEFEEDDWNIHKKKKKPEGGPIIRFQCGDENNGQLQENLCRSANLCLVKSDPLLWAAYYSNSSNVQNTSDIDSDQTPALSQYNHSDLRRRFSAPKNHPNHSSHSAILTMVDTVHYLRSGKMTARTRLGPVFFIWECFLNKASYALRTNRDLYIWIGGFEGDKDSNNTESILHHRNTETVSRTFGATCKPEVQDKNVVHYYKPIAFGALFRKLRSQGQGINGDDKKVWFVDADIYFNKEAFPINEQDDERQSLDDYFHISPQAALLGSQNPSGKEDNILINGGLLGLRGSANEPIDPLDDWVTNLSALWWYCRCGERDQIALWLLLFATWSAESGTANFVYPKVIFENYMFAWYGVIPHAKAFLPRLQQIWNQETKNSTSNSDIAWPTVPANANIFDGGNWLESTDGNVGGSYTYPLELPHVLLLPLEPFEVPSEGLASREESPTDRMTPPPKSQYDIGIVRKNQIEKKTLLTHTKNVRDVCYKFKCWPYLIREDPRGSRLKIYDKLKKQKQKELEEEENESEEITEENDSENNDFDVTENTL